VRFKAIVTHISDITTIEEFAAVAILCSGTLITNKLIIDRNPIKIYAASLWTMLSSSRRMHPALRTRTPSTSILVFCYKFRFPPFMVLIVALLNDGIIMTLLLTTCCHRHNQIVGIWPKSSPTL